MSILINGVKIPLNKFPDGTFNIKPDVDAIIKHKSDKSPVNAIIWKYEREEELVALIYITKFMREQMGEDDICLMLPYIPNARQDRCHGADVVFTLKYFAEIINSLNFVYVLVLDPHSDVAPSMIKGCSAVYPTDIIRYAVTDIGDPDIIPYFPDDGAVKRSSGAGEWKDFCYGVKKRDFDTGKITGLTIMREDLVRGKNVLIIDDICSRGGTAYYSAIALKNAGANDIYCCFTHCENTIFEGDLLGLDFVKAVYTSDSIASRRDINEKIKTVYIKYRSDSPDF